MRSPPSTVVVTLLMIVVPVTMPRTGPRWDATTRSATPPRLARQSGAGDPRTRGMSFPSGLDADVP